MIVDDLKIEGIARLPAETNPPLLVDTYAELSGSVSAHHF
jgi:N-acyl-L-homoserine lactone synthetase